MLEFFPELKSKRLYESSGKQKKSCCRCCLVFTISAKREIRHFHVVVVQWRQRNVQKSVMHVQSCCFANLNLLLFCRSRWRRRRRCLSSPVANLTITSLRDRGLLFVPGGYLGKFLPGMCRVSLTTPTPIQSILWPIINPTLVTFG